MTTSIFKLFIKTLFLKIIFKKWEEVITENANVLLLHPTAYLERSNVS